jgi:outer membrane biogenesis lipoprotein LolB
MKKHVFLMLSIFASMLLTGCCCWKKDKSCTKTAVETQQKKNVRDGGKEIVEIDTADVESENQ